MAKDEVDMDCWLNVRLEESLKDAAQKLADDRDETISQVVRRFLRAWVANKGRMPAEYFQ